MNEPSDRGDMIVIDDVELLTRYLNEQLDAERVAIVRRRLQEDRAFQDWAAPLVLAFRLPADSDTRPRPPGEIEKHWDRFTKAAGFVHQRRAARKRRLWIVAIAIAALGLGAFLMRGRIRDAWADRRDFALVSDKPGHFILPDSTSVELGPNSRLRIRKKSTDPDFYAVKLDGTARFLVRRWLTTGGTMKPHVLNVILPAGMLLAFSADFSVATHGDTADIAVFRRDRSLPGASADPNPDFVMLTSNDFRLRQISIGEDERGRVRKGAPAERFLPPEPLTLAPLDPPLSEHAPATAPQHGDTIMLRDSIRVFLDPGAKVQEDPSSTDKVVIVTLTGSARFRMRPFALRENMMPVFDNTLRVHTRASVVASVGADFQVRALGDTTAVEVLDRHLVATIGGRAVPLMERVLLFAPDTSLTEPQMLHSGEHARVVRGQLVSSP